MYLGYAAFMLCRNTLISTSATMVADPTLGLDTEGYGRLMAWHSAGAIVGKLVTGIGADIIGGRRMFLLALALTAAANVAMGMASSLFLFGFLNFFGQFFKAGGWPAMAKLIGSWYPKKSHGRVWSIISTSSRVGTIAAVLILGFLLSLVSWRTVFMISAALTGVIVVIGYFTLKERPEAVGLAPIEDEPAVDTPIKKVAHPFDHLTRGKACLAFATSARFWLICLSLAFLCIMMDFLNFIPLFLVQTLGAEPSDASMAGSAFPAGMFLALIATAIFYDRLTKKQLVYVLGGLLGISCLCVLLLWNLGNLPLPAGSGLYVAMAAIFLFGFSISPAYYIPMSVFFHCLWREALGVFDRSYRRLWLFGRPGV